MPRVTLLAQLLQELPLATQDEADQQFLVVVVHPGKIEVQQMVARCRVAAAHHARRHAQSCVLGRQQQLDLQRLARLVALGALQANPAGADADLVLGKRQAGAWRLELPQPFDHIIELAVQQLRELADRRRLHPGSRDDRGDAPVDPRKELVGTEVVAFPGDCIDARHAAHGEPQTVVDAKESPAVRAAPLLDHLPPPDQRTTPPRPPPASSRRSER